MYYEKLQRALKNFELLQYKLRVCFLYWSICIKVYKSYQVKLKWNRTTLYYWLTLCIEVSTYKVEEEGVKKLPRYKLEIIAKKIVNKLLKYHSLKNGHIIFGRVRKTIYQTAYISDLYNWEFIIFLWRYQFYQKADYRQLEKNRIFSYNISNNNKIESYVTHQKLS